MSLVQTAQETLDAIERGGYTSPSGRAVALRAAVDAAVRGSCVYRPAELDAVVAALQPTAPVPLAVEVTGETTGAAGRRLVHDEGVAHVVALNFASARNPGGGFLGGAKAQEEDLARCSALYPCLAPQSIYYDANRRESSLLYTDHMIYSPDVPFFRDDQYRFLDDAFALSIITAPAPNAGAALARDPSLGDELRAALLIRARKVLAVAAARHHRCLVLGAWGCGVFRNDPAAVADAFARGLGDARFAGAFDRVVFACHPPGGRNRDVFARRFA